MTLMFIRGHRATGKLELCIHSVVKLYEAIQMFVKVEYVGEMTVNKFCKYGEHGLVENLLFL